MAAYLIADLQVHDADLAAKYREQVTPLVAKHGGTYLARGGDVRALEGDWTPGRLVVIQFPSVDVAQAFYDDPAYAPVMDIRQKSATGSVVIIEGVPT
ncbi:MAG: DUF1330 domain-containing protein [Pseudomonadota bacterium]